MFGDCWSTYKSSATTSACQRNISLYNPDTPTENVTAPSIKASVNLEKAMTCNVEITEIVDDLKKVLNTNNLHL